MAFEIHSSAHARPGTMARMLSTLWPLYGLSIRTPRLELHLPTDDELAALAGLAGSGIHEPGERPFLTPWTEGAPIDRARAVLQGQWSQLASWAPENWQLGLGVFRAGEPIGMVTLRAGDFAVVREVKTSSWLGLAHHRQGHGTEARVGLLTLAFEHLGAVAALTEVFQDNGASQGVSRKLGYLPDGISRDARDGEALVSDRLRLTVDRWREQQHPTVAVSGVEECLSSFGLAGPT